MQIRLLAIFALLGCVAAAQVQAPALPDPSGSYDWREEAKKLGLNPADRQKLAEQKVLMANEAFRQVFEAYKVDRSRERQCPVFITSDSILNAFHVLLEDTMMGFELRNAHELVIQMKALHLALKALEMRCQGDPELGAAALRHARFILGVAVKLLDNETMFIDAEDQTLVHAEVKRIRAAQGPHQPAWLKRCRDSIIAIDYGRFEPLGIYTRSGELARYFRAVRWLQAVPFRIDVEEELISFLLLGKCLFLVGDTGLRSQARFWREFIGHQDDPDLLALTAMKDLPIQGRWPHLFLRKTRLLEIRKTLRQRFGRDFRPMINDQIRYGIEEPGFRILSACRTPDAILFQRTTDLKRFRNRTLPTGLEVCVALGSKPAAGLLVDPYRDRVLETIASARPLFAGTTLYESYLQCLSSLIEEPDPRAPAFMKADPWQRKNLQAVLASWAQIRYTFNLQAKSSVWVLGGARGLAGFVEPMPEFFARLGRVAAQTRKMMSAASKSRKGHRNLARQMQNVVGWLRACDFAAKGWPACLKLKKDRFLQVLEVYQPSQ